MNKICPFFSQCGGCLYQDLPHDVYVEKKRRFIERSFSDKGITLNLDQFIEAPLKTRRRAGFAFYNGRLGFNEHNGHKIVEITDCCLLTEKITRLLPAFRQLIQKIGGQGDLFVLDTVFGIDIHIVSKGRRLDLALTETICEWVGAHNDIVRVMFNKTPVLEKAPLPVPSADSFLQPSVFGEETLIRLVLEQAVGFKTALDLFCGSGTFLKPLQAAGLKVTGYDIACEALSSLGNVVQSRDLFRNPLLSDEMSGIDFAVIDPPRAGALAQIQQLADSHVKKIVMISCNPVTAARDTRYLLNNGWQISSATALDQFTYSNHAEIILIFLKK